jgi:bifunctional non-homologous end joining protein LigD
VRLISRNGNRFTGFGDLWAGIEFAPKAKHAIVDGEIVCVDEHGHSQFNELLFRRGSPRFAAFDLLYLNGKDLRQLPLIEQKRALRKVVPISSPVLIFVDHIEGEGEHLFQLAVFAGNRTRQTFWRKREAAGAPEIGWDVCTRVCAAASVPNKT